MPIFVAVLKLYGMWEALLLFPAVVIGLVDLYFTRKSLAADRAARAAAELEGSNESEERAV